MKHLIIFAHPNESSLNASLKNWIVQYLEQQQQEVQVRDLNKMCFNPVLSQDDMFGQFKGTVDAEVGKEQELITWADQLIFVYPIWWTGMPAILKGYIDRVFSYGFAYRYDKGIQKGLLSGKKAVILNTHGKSQTEYEAIGMNEALKLTSDKGIFAYCGLEIIAHFYFDRADRATEDVIRNWKEELEKLFLSIPVQ
ncbi:NAD(P)H-dependent oxidoreductase [Flavihumibacter sp. UBA7668]|uniref:NAD(P)H-dependent oxidoreductase n=1 Tax=Flavihumibacter sp. UBA7668 TaxID=1946542 RepID=UPI0025C49A77|nr:NAD(P)H-dependent oxidoreductase [Flavihumibacter sp. UBA7668]